MLRILLLTSLIALGGLTKLSAQSSSPDIDYAKAMELYEAARYDEAVRMCNKILSEDEDHLPALMLRARTKYELGAFKGTKIDAFKYMEIGGATKEVIRMMALAEYRMGDYRAAGGYINTAIELDPYDANLYFLAGEVEIETGMRTDACELYAQGAILGSSRAERAVNDICGGIGPWRDKIMAKNEMPASSPAEDAPAKEEEAEDPASETTEEEDEATDPFGMIEDETKDSGILEPTGNPEEKNTDTKDTTSSDVEPSEIDLDPPARTESPKEEELPPVNIDASQEIVIDDQISISINNGLGEREVDYQPAIFMLSDTDGNVVIDICVNAKGRVTEAVFNRETSSIFRSSLTSLALRKAKQFTFLPSKRDDQCGSLIYRIKA